MTAWEEKAIENLEREIRSIRRKYYALSRPFSEVQPLDPNAEAQRIRVGGIGQLVYPHEGILDAISTLAMNVWHVKDYVKDCLPKGKQRQVENFADGSTELKIVADLANEKKHARLDRPRSKLSPGLGLLDDGKLMLGVVRFDTSRSGMVEFAYNGRNKSHRIWAEKLTPIPFGTDIVVTMRNGTASKGDAVQFIYDAYRQWQTLFLALGIQVRKEATE